MTQQLLLGEVAKILGCRPHQIDYLLKTRQVPGPEQRISNKRLFVRPQRNSVVLRSDDRVIQPES